MASRAIGLPPSGALISRCPSRGGHGGISGRGQTLRARACVYPTASDDSKRDRHHRRPVHVSPGSRRVTSWLPKPCSDLVTRSSSDASSVAPTTAPSLDPSKIAVRATTESAELRGAAAARALAFYTYPSDRSEFSIRSHRNMRIDAEWDAIGEKIRGEDVAFRDTRVECVVVALTLDEDGALPDGFAYDANTLDAACVVPKSETTPALLILGTLDVNQGAKLPAEELAGMHPGTDDPVPEGTDISQDSFGTNKGNYGNGESDFDAKIRAYEDSLGTRPVRYRRGYLSNVCVLAAARRLGIGHLLMEESLKVGKTWGIETMYVHVEAENVGAKRFYEKNGFEVCEQETEAYALSLSRPRRLLLSRTVGGGAGGE